MIRSRQEAAAGASFAVVLAAAGLMLGIPALGADVVVMKNGDRVTGSVVKKQGGKLTINSVYFGTVTLPWEQVESITTEGELHAELTGGEKLQGRLASAEGKLQIGEAVTTPDEVAVLRNAAEQAAYERMLHPGWGRLWAGTATLGWAGTLGNAQTTTFSLGMNAARATNTDRTTLHFTAVKASAFSSGVKSETARAVRGGIGYGRDVNGRVFANGFSDWEYDRFQALDLRVTLGGGLGLNAWKGERGRLDMVAGGAWSRAQFAPLSSPPFSRNSAEAYWGGDLSLKLGSRTSLTHTCRMFNNLSQTGEYRVNCDLGASTAIWKWFSWNFSVSDRYLSNPAPGRKTNDLIYTTGVGVNFSR